MGFINVAKIMLILTVRMFNFRSLRRTTAEIQSYSFEPLNSGKILDRERDRDTTSQDSGISQMSVGPGDKMEALEERMEDLNISTNSVKTVKIFVSTNLFTSDSILHNGVFFLFFFRAGRHRYRHLHILSMVSLIKPFQGTQQIVKMVLFLKVVSHSFCSFLFEINKVVYHVLFFF